jgi:hypothetical protein
MPRSPAFRHVCSIWTLYESFPPWTPPVSFLIVTCFSCSPLAYKPPASPHFDANISITIRSAHSSQKKKEKKEKKKKKKKTAVSALGVIRAWLCVGVSASKRGREVLGVLNLRSR